jgi:hypothetical protein
MRLVWRFVGARVAVRRVGLSVAVALALAGCESVMRGASDRLQVTSSPPGAEVKTSTGETCLTPCGLQLGQAADYSVTVSKRGFKTERFSVGENCSRTVDVVLRPNASITSFEMPDRDLPLVTDCARRATAGSLITGLSPLH